MAALIIDPCSAAQQQKPVVCTLHCLITILHAHHLSAESTGALYRRWYEVLAPFLCKERAASEALLALCRQLW